MTEQVLLFDLDGTLIDSIELILSSFRHTAAVHGVAPVDDEDWIAGIGTPLRSQLAGFAQDDEEIDAMVATYREHNLAHHDRLVRPYPGVVDAIGTVARRARLGLVTSKSRRGAFRGLHLCGLDGFFEVVVAVDDVERHKPDPEPVTMALERLGAHADTTMFVGDSPHDLAAGRAAGVRTAAALWGPFRREDLEPHEPDVWLEEPTAIAGL